MSTRPHTPPGDLNRKAQLQKRLRCVEELLAQRSLFDSPARVRFLQGVRSVSTPSRWMRSGRALLARVTGGYVDRLTGEFFPSPYRVVVERGMVTVFRKEG